ncbi:MAG: hypothetical protein JSR61_14425 [Proteobacteria bacterium]|nr:hypothetical protein [Pseudomonadota bacterium]
MRISDHPGGENRFEIDDDADLVIGASGRRDWGAAWRGIQKSPLTSGRLAIGGAPEQLVQYVKDQSVLWRRVVKEAGVKAN